MAAGICALPGATSSVAKLAKISRHSLQEATTCACIPPQKGLIGRRAPTPRSIPGSCVLQSLQHSQSWSVGRSVLKQTRTKCNVQKRSGKCAPCCAALEALVFDCDGVILESEDLHRQAYNAAFEHFNVRCPDVPDCTVDWTPEFYDELQNKVGECMQVLLGETRS
jgi:hypothetical protein